MNDKSKLSVKKHTYTLIEQIKTEPKGTIEYKRNKQREIFSFNPSKNLSDEMKWSLALTCFEASNSVFNRTDEKNSFSFTTPSHWFQKNLLIN